MDRGFDFFSKKLERNANIDSKVSKFLRFSKLRSIYSKIKGAFYHTFRNKKVIVTFDEILSEFDEILSQLILDNSKKFAIWFHFMEVHGPWYGIFELSFIKKLRYSFYMHGLRTKAYANKYYKNYYMTMVKMLDQKLEKLFDYLDTKGLLKNTFVIITSDHGEEFFEHGRGGHDPIAPSWDVLIRVPLIIYKKGEFFSKSEKKSESEKLISLIDIAPSFLKLLNKKIPKPFVGYDTILGKYHREFVFSDRILVSSSKFIDAFYTIRTKNRKYFINGSNQWECIHIDKDTDEKNIMLAT